MPDISVENLRDEIVSAFHLEQVPEERRQEMIDLLTESAMRRIILAVGERIPEESDEEFAKLAEGSDAEAMSAFIARFIPDPDALMREVVAGIAKNFSENDTAASSLE